MQLVKRYVSFFRRDPKAYIVEIEMIKLLGVVAQRMVAASGHIGDDRAHRCLDVGRNFTLGVKKSAEFFVKIRGACIEANGHPDAFYAAVQRCRASFLL